MPLILGDGVRLFQAPLEKSEFLLEKVTAWKSGAASLHYRKK